MNGAILDTRDRALALSVKHELHGMSERLESYTEEFTRGALLTVALLGEFSVGKSSLLNSMLDIETLPVKVKPTTSLVTEIEYGELAFQKVSRGEEYSITEVEFQALAAGNTSSEPGDVLKISMRDSLLEEGIRFVDTPGVQSMNEHHEDITYGYLPRVDVALMVLDATRGEVPRSILNFLQDHVLKRDLGKLIFVLNKVDDLPESQRTRVEEKVRETLCRVTPDPRVLSVSAHQSDPGDPGVQPIRALLVDEIIPARMKLLQRRMIKSLRADMTRLQQLISTKAHASNLEPDEFESQIDWIKAKREEARSSLGHLRRKVDSDFDALQLNLRKYVVSLLERVSERATRLIQQSDPAHVEKLDLQIKISGWIAQEIEVMVHQELEPELEQIAQQAKGQVMSLKTSSAAITADLDISQPVDGALDLVVEGILLVALNIILPGEFLVALIGRVVGNKLLKSIKQPLVDMLRGIASHLTQGALRQKLSAKVKQHIMSLEDELYREINGTLLARKKDMIDAVDSHINDVLNEHEDALHSAREELQRYAAEQQSWRESLALDVSQIAQMLEEDHMQEEGRYAR